MRELATRLKADGLRVWFDEWELRPGDSIPAKIEEGLDWRAEARDGEYRRLLNACTPERANVELAEPGPEARIISLGHTDGVRSVAWSPDGRFALTGSDDYTVRLWEVETGHCLRVLEGHLDGVNSVAWSPDGRRALSGSDDNTVRVWEVESGRTLGVLKGHTNSLWSVTWSPDGRRALSGSDDNTVRVWEAESGRMMGVLEGHTDYVRSVAWSPGWPTGGVWF